MSENPPAFSAIYEQYHRKVVAYAATLLGMDQAEDIAQEVFVKVGRSLRTLSDESKLTSWIYAITLNTVRDHARKRGPDVDRIEPIDDEADPVSQAQDTASRSPEQTAIRNEMVACYLDYVRRLPRRYYVVYVLSEFEDLSNQEIADRQIPVARDGQDPPAPSSRSPLRRAAAELPLLRERARRADE